MSVRGRGKGRWALAVSLGCLAVLAMVPSVAVADATVTGKVTNAKDEALEGVEVRYYSSENEYGRYVTEKNGEYGKDINAESGQFKVEFVPPAGSGYVPQYYDEKLSYAAATTVTVEENKTTSVSAVLAKGGTIEGSVASATPPYAGVAHIEVTAYEKSAPNTAIGHAETNQFGIYLLTGLQKGSYVLGFKDAFGSNLDYAPQFYPEKERFLEAKAVSVGEGEDEPGIDARLVQGASISGTVTDAATSQLLAGITVVATAPGGAETLEARTSTGVNGNYTLAGLGSGSLDILFQQLTQGEVKPGEVRYVPQFYKEDDFPEHISSVEELFIGATPVEVRIPNTTSGIDAAMVRVEPANKVAPVASGTPAVGQTLGCSQGSWTGIGTLTYGYKWLRNGVAIAGAGSNTYGVQSADQGTGLACVVTATNEIEKAVTRSISATSNTLTVPSVMGSPAPIPPKPKLTLSSSKIVVSSGTARVPIACAVAHCSGSIELTEQKLVRSHKGKKTTSKKETVVLAKGTYSLAARHSATIDVRLTAQGKSALARAKGHELPAKIHVALSGGTALNKSVELTEVAPAKRKGEHR